MRLVAALVTGLAVICGGLAHAGGPLRLPEDASAEALVLALSAANGDRVTCLWREAGRGTRVTIGKTALAGRLECDPRVVEPWLAGRTRGARAWLVTPSTGTAIAFDRYGEPGAFFGRAKETSDDLGGDAASLWERARAPMTVVVLPGGGAPPLPLPPDPTCAGEEPFVVEELVSTLSTARERMDLCWPRNAPRSALTFDIVTDRGGHVVPTPLASLRREPKVVDCLVRALARVQFDPERARCHQVRTQWPVTSGP